MAKTVFLVDDDPTQRRLMQAVCERAGYYVCQAGDGEQAIEFMRSDSGKGVSVGLFDDGTPGEVFVKMSKEGSTLSGLMQAFCRAFSLALQYGLPLDEAVRRFKDMRFEPMGTTSNPDVPEAKSIIDYVARYLEVQFCETADRV